MADKTLTCKDCNSEFILQRANRLSTRKKVLRTNPKDARIAESKKNGKK